MTGQGADVLAAMQLTHHELAALAQQGFVAVEARGKQRRYKLRFRLAGQQRVRCLGSDPDRAEQVRLAVLHLQAPRQQERQLGTLCEEIRQALRASLEELSPLLAEAGFHRHGTAIRKSRKRKTSSSE